MDFHGDGFFTVDTPKFKSQYSQVIWHTLAPTPLPEDIVKKFDGKVMSVTGWEVDVLRDVNGTATPVPCYESYNHHYGGALQGKGADLQIVEESDDEPMIGHGGPRMVFTNNEHASGNYPTSQNFAEHNGNEARQTLHWMPEGYGTPIESPTAFVFTPMQINTRNPDGSGRRCGSPGTNCPMPHQQNAWKGAPWSGILECPCNYGGNTRMIKTFDHRVEANECTYNSTVTIASECFEAAAADKSLKVTQNATVTDASMPYGCSVSTDGSVVTYNTATTKTSCSGAGQCICRATTGWINGKRFDPGCIGEPRSELLKTHNPTCDINLYDGGLQCCGGTDIVDGVHTKTRFLLDADAEIPPLVDEVWFRWRFYYEECKLDYTVCARTSSRLAPEMKPKGKLFVLRQLFTRVWVGVARARSDTPSLQDTYHIEWQFGNIEYSVPKAAPGTPPEEARHTLTTHFQVKDLHSQSSQCSGSKSCTDWDLAGGLQQKPIKLIMLGFHCHSPSCKVSN